MRDALSVLVTIRKLKRLSKSPNAHEATAARAKANALRKLPQVRWLFDTGVAATVGDIVERQEEREAVARQVAARPSRTRARPSRESEGR
jgi:hypothetical protein